MLLVPLGVGLGLVDDEDADHRHSFLGAPGAYSFRRAPEIPQRNPRGTPEEPQRLLLANGYVATLDDAGTEVAGGWVLVRGAVVEAVGGGAEPEADERIDLGGALVTPGLVNTHHHLYQTLTRARAQEADLFGWLRELYPVWARIDAEAEYAAARTGLAELALSGCTTVFDHHYVFPPGRSGILEAEVQAARELGVRIVASRGSMDLGESNGGLPPDGVVERDRRRAVGDGARRGALHEAGPGRPRPDRGRTLLAVLGHPAADGGVGVARAQARPPAPHPPGGDAGGGGVLPRALRLHAGRVPRGRRLAGQRRLVRALRPPVGRRDRPVRSRPAPASRTARPRTCAWAPASRPCASCAMRASRSGWGSTARRRTSGATSASRSSRRCSSPAAAAARRR